MHRQQPIPNQSGENHDIVFRQAIVIGSGIAGLAAARVLANHAARVTIVERDHHPDESAVRPGTPQAHHPHNLQPMGQHILEQLLPGVTAELAAAHAVRLDQPADIAFHYAGEWHTVHPGGRHAIISCSRSLLEETLSRRIRAHAGIEILYGHEVTGLLTRADGRRVGGVRLRPRPGAAEEKEALSGDIVIDASGRRSEAPHWLARLGFRPPEEWHIDAQVGYASRLYRRPADFGQRWKMLYIRPTPPGSTRGGVIVPMEGDRWHVALMGVAGDYPPTDEAAFISFARSLPTPALFEAISDAEPLDRIHGWRRTDNRVRRYDALPRFLEGFLVIGDAAYALNPVYSQGMTAALLSIEALAGVLQDRAERLDKTVDGLAQTFQCRLSEAVESPWRLATRIDWQWEATSIDDNTDSLLG